MSNTLFLEAVPDERKTVASSRFRDSRSVKLRKREQENKRASLFSDFCTPFTASSLLSKSLEQAIKNAVCIIVSVLKQINPEGTMPEPAQSGVHVLITITGE